jgi:hypothetical protein
LDAVDPLSGPETPMLAALKDFLGRPPAPVPSGAERRQAPRVSVPPECTIKVGSQSYPLLNWSVLGFIAGPYSGSLVPKQRFKLSIKVRQDHFDIDFDSEATVVRIDATGIAARFVFLPPEKKRQIETYFAYYQRAR